MTPFDSHLSARAGILEYLMNNPPPTNAVVRAALVNTDNMGSPVVHVMATLEALYSIHTDLPIAGKLLIGRLAAFVVQYDFYGINIDGRGLRMMQAMQRDMGETAPTAAGWPDPQDDPAPAAQFVAQPEIVAEPLPS